MPLFFLNTIKATLLVEAASVAFKINLSENVSQFLQFLFPTFILKLCFCSKCFWVNLLVPLDYIKHFKFSFHFGFIVFQKVYFSYSPTEKLER